MVVVSAGHEYVDGTSHMVQVLSSAADMLGMSVMCVMRSWWSV